MYPLESRIPTGDKPNSDELLDLFLSYVEGEGLELYPAQEDAILSLYQGNNVILNTPTGSGKSLVAVALHFWSMANKRTSYYTCPIKALVNEKFLSLCKIFGPKNVGMATGDASVNPDAPIICCTAEILANLSLRLGEETPVHDVVMDEFHYYSDRDRGVAWQVPLLTLPYSRFLLMSATIGDPEPFQKILSDLTHKKCDVVKNQDRPVPLEFIYKEETLHRMLEKLSDTGKTPIYLVNFTQRECAEHAQSLLSIEMASKEEKSQITDLLKSTKFNSPYGKELKKVLRHGVGIHHAGMLPKYRLAVEKLAQKGLLKVICGTDTLGVGVNIPIRSVLFSKLCKFDGQKVGVLTVRDFQQISGRAGRRGFDDQGTVVVLAPEHVVENKMQEAKIGDDAKKLKKFKRKAAPTRGFVYWDEKTFEKLRDSNPELLRSSFKVNHGMLLNVLSRRTDGCRGMKDLVRNCHESDVTKSRMRMQSFMLLRSLLEKDLVEFVDDENGKRKKIQIKVELQDDFSLFQDLGIWLVDAIPLLDPEAEDYDLDLMTLVEAITENPKAILFKQIDKLKGQKVNELKQQGVDYDERMEILEGVTYPKPNSEMIYESFNEFSESHPWIGADSIRPKSIAREMYENYMSFDEYVKEYGLQRSEGILLRYLTEVYKILLQSVPENFRNESVNEMILFIQTVVTQVDKSLMAEWEKLLDPSKTLDETVQDKPNSSDDTDVTSNKRGFTVLVRNESYRILRALAQKNYRSLVSFIEPKRPTEGNWQERNIDELMNGYFSDHSEVLLDRNSRSPDFFVMKWDGNNCSVAQTLTDPEEKNDWSLFFHVDIEQSKLEQKAVVFLDDIREI